ncbi:MAG: DUF86 domain-containing protein [Candidatus Aminicenantes bacterium]|nr:DUF86 domain-containing protein [Candidatus Aminicenantes bacterium]
MPQFDSDRMMKLVSHMREAVRQLNRLKKCKKESFLNDPDKIGSTKYHFIIAIEATIDMCNHLISRNGYRAPEDYSDAFVVLGENGAFEKSFIESLKEMARFRNRLVHIYWEIDENQICNILRDRLGDFKTFLNQLARFLDWPDIS